MKALWKSQGTQRRLHSGMTYTQKCGGALGLKIDHETQHTYTCSSFVVRGNTGLLWLQLLGAVGFTAGTTHLCETQVHRKWLGNNKAAQVKLLSEWKMARGVMKVDQGGMVSWKKLLETSYVGVTEHVSVGRALGSQCGKRLPDLLKTRQTQSERKQSIDRECLHWTCSTAFRPTGGDWELCWWELCFSIEAVCSLLYIVHESASIW